MNIRDFQYIIAVAQFRHFGKAAEACFVSQPTLSGQIKKLEETLGVSLFERSNKKVTPTPIGLEVIGLAKNIIDIKNQIKQVAEMAKNPLSGHFYLGAFPTLAPYLFPKIIPHIKQSMPDLKLILHEEKTDILITKLKEGVIDAAFLALPVNENSLDQHILFEDIFHLAVPTGHPLSSKKKVNIKDIEKYPLLLLEEGHCLRDQALDICHQHHYNPDDLAQDLRGTSLETLLNMVAAGTGITITPDISRKTSEYITYLSFEDHQVPYRKIGLFWRKSSVKKEIMETISGFDYFDE